MKHFNQGIIIALVLLLSGCASMQVHSEKNTTKRITIKAPIQEVYNMALHTAMQMNWEITFSNESTYSFGGKTPELMSRWGDVVNIFISETPEGSVLTVSSRLGHRPNVEYIESYLNKVVENTEGK